jgi:hypothetical protein
MDGWGRAALDDVSSPSFLGRFSFQTKTFKKFEFIEVIYIKNSQGRG